MSCRARRACASATTAARSASRCRRRRATLGATNVTLHATAGPRRHRLPLPLRPCGRVRDERADGSVRYFRMRPALAPQLLAQQSYFATAALPRSADGAVRLTFDDALADEHWRRPPATRANARELGRDRADFGESAPRAVGSGQPVARPRVPLRSVAACPADRQDGCATPVRRRPRRPRHAGRRRAPERLLRRLMTARCRPRASRRTRTACA